MLKSIYHGFYLSSVFPKLAGSPISKQSYMRYNENFVVNIHCPFSCNIDIKEVSNDLNTMTYTCLMCNIVSNMLISSTFMISEF